MTCQTCDSNRLATINGHSKDLASIQVGGVYHDGYLPTISNVCSGDDIDIIVCLECGQLQGDWPVDDPDFEDKEVDYSYAVTTDWPPPKESAGDCPVKLPGTRCRLLVPLEFGSNTRPVGHEMFVFKETATHAMIHFMQQDILLEKGTEVQIIQREENG
jgi:hypothetical protein